VQLSALQQTAFPFSYYLIVQGGKGRPASGVKDPTNFTEAAAEIVVINYDSICDEQWFTELLYLV
jgi:hypothetical protein